MSRLLAAGFTRLKKSKIFWLLMVMMFALGIFFPVSQYNSMQKYNTSGTLDSPFFLHVMFMGILTAVFCSLFIGTEYSDGTIRNKLIVGHSRKSIYLSNLILCTAAGAAISISYMTACLIAGLPLIGSFQMGTKAAVILMLFSIVITTTYTALFTLASMLIHNKAILSIVTVISAFMLLMAASYIYASLSQPEMYTDYIMNESGKVTQSEPVPNTHYVRGAKREVYEFLMEFLPSGQDLMIISAEAPVEKMVIYDLCIITASTGLGLWGFLKKDIK